jgi:hypothetical protein
MFRNLIAQLWKDDAGAVISTELLLVSSISLFGAISGLTSMRNALNSAQATYANAVMSISPNFSYAGYELMGSNGNPIASVPGVNFQAPAPQFVSAQPMTINVPNLTVSAVP